MCECLPTMSVRQLLEFNRIPWTLQQHSYYTWPAHQMRNLLIFVRFQCVFCLLLLLLLLNHALRFFPLVLFTCCSLRSTLYFTEFNNFISLSNRKSSWYLTFWCSFFLFFFSLFPFLVTTHFVVFVSVLFPIASKERWTKKKTTTKKWKKNETAKQQQKQHKCSLKLNAIRCAITELCVKGARECVAAAVATEIHSKSMCS